MLPMELAEAVKKQTDTYIFGFYLQNEAQVYAKLYAEDKYTPHEI